MTPVKKTLEKVEAVENDDEEEDSEKLIEKKQFKEKKDSFEEQLTQLEATFILDKVIDLRPPPQK